MNYFNYHTHSNFCDGKESPEAFVKEAIRQNFHSLGFSSHAPVPFENNFSLQSSEQENYCHEIRRLQQEYKNEINVFLALEIDYIPGITRDFSSFQNECNLDYTIGGVHLVKRKENNDLWFIDGHRQEIYDNGLKNIFDDDIQGAVKTYFHQLNEMIENEKPDIIAHMDKIRMHNRDRYFTEEDLWYQQLVLQSLESIKEGGNIIEVNTRGIYKKRSVTTFPSPWALKQIREMNIPVTISTDAHHPSEISLGIDDAVNLLLDIGFDEVLRRDENQWQAISLKELLK